MATISIVKGAMDILETATSPKEFNHLGSALLNAEKLKEKHKVDVKEPSVLIVHETIEDLICWINKLIWYVLYLFYCETTYS